MIISIKNSIIHKLFIIPILFIFTITIFQIDAYAQIAYPDYSNQPYVVINNNVPDFSESEKKSSVSYEEYGDMDDLGRCTYAIACIGQDLMPTEARTSISSVQPTGWQTAKYDIVDGKYLYNRCHLIGYQLTAENANIQNLITGTRYLNVDGMLPFENMVADYIKETNNHVLYRVVPIFEGDNLVASGVTIEGYSIEDNGDGICFNVFCYNVQPGISINYSTGESAENNDIFVNDSNHTHDNTELYHNERYKTFISLVIIIFIIVNVARNSKRTGRR